MATRELARWTSNTSCPYPPFPLHIRALLHGVEETNGTNADRKQASAKYRSIRVVKNGSLDLAESTTTKVVVEDCYRYRRPGLALDPGGGTIAHRVYTGHKQKLQLQGQEFVELTCKIPSQDLHSIGAGDTFHLPDRSDMAQSSQQGTQQATQPYENPRRLGRNISDVSEDDASDVICLLHPNSPAAFQAVHATMLHAPEHILQNDDLDGITEEDILFNPALQIPREFALRISSTVKKPTDGFRFGRNPALCDVLLTSNQHDKLISNVHFKIFVNNQGSLMLQDLSTNGTIVENEHLRAKDKVGRTVKPSMRALKNGDIVCLLGGPEQQEIKLMVRFPNRGENEERYDQKLKQYLSQRGRVANFSSMRESTFGNHWSGGMQYNFTGMLGKGAFATVYRIQTKNEGIIYAAKELDKRRFVKNGHLDTKFDSELKIMKDLKHPNIVEYIDCQFHQHWIYIIMEYVPYGELSKELQERKYIEERQTQSIAKQVMRALDYLHRRNITHRDIKPDNILISCRDPLVVKLSDFGLSKCVNDQETFLKTFCGTLLYCAPEVYPDYNSYAAGTMKRRRAGEPAPKTSPYDQSVDMWSLGAVLFHILCGKPPIMGRGDDRGAQMLNNIMTQAVDFQPLRAYNVSEVGIDLINKLLNKSPSARPKERICLEHPWLKNVPDPFEYDADDTVPEIVTRWELEVVEEVDEDLIDEELIQDLNQLTQHPASSVPPASSDAERPPKRPRTTDSMTVPTEVAYPQLPQQPSLLPPVPATSGPRLFGEISPSLMQSSGVFGQATPPRPVQDVPELRHKIDQVSVNDYATFNDFVSHQGTDVSGEPMQYPNALHVPSHHDGAAPSLLGAEAQIGQLQMASPEAAHSEVVTPDTTNPITPRTREISPSSSVSKSANDEASSIVPANDVKFNRRIDVNLLHDHTAFAASLEAREASRLEKRRFKAQTFHTQPPTASESAKTIDVHTGREVQSQGDIPSAPIFSRTINLPRLDQSGDLNLPLTRFGKLTPVPGSFGETQTIFLDARVTLWGRGIDSTIQYPDVKDVRIPKYAIKLLFWAPGMETHVEHGSDWRELPGMRTYISTSATKSISVNDFELRKESPDGEAALYGKVYTGDIITVYQGPSENEFLKYEVEIFFGDSGHCRPEKEQPFMLRKEMQYHRQAKERESMRKSTSNSDHSDVAKTVASAP